MSETAETERPARRPFACEKCKADEWLSCDLVAIHGVRTRLCPNCIDAWHDFVHDVDGEHIEDFEGLLRAEAAYFATLAQLHDADSTYDAEDLGLALIELEQARHVVRIVLRNWLGRTPKA